ncbi:MAG TPA: hypothetical protein VMR21_01885 [Vicinamibacteria bacterium]|nr:hypothetical protein [Vicinamibacteria bacterium]
MTRIAVAIAGLAVSAVAAEEPSRGPLLLYVSAAPAESRLDGAGETREALKVRRDRARAVRHFREKQLKREHGKRRESWPSGPAEELGRLEEAQAMAEARYEYRRSDPQGVSEATHEIMEFFQEKRTARSRGRVRLCSSVSEADLVVEVAASRSAKTLPTQKRPDRCYVLFTVGAGGAMDPARFARVPRDYRMRKVSIRIWRIAGPRPERPVFYFESYNGGGKEFGCVNAAANAASAAVDTFIDDNYQVLARP